MFNAQSSKNTILLRNCKDMDIFFLNPKKQEKKDRNSGIKYLP